MFILVALLTTNVTVKADFWGEPVKKESVKVTKSKRKVSLNKKSGTTKTVKGAKKKKETSSTKISNGTKVDTTIQTVTQNITKYKKGSRTKTVTTVKTVTTTTYTYTYYYDLKVETKSYSQGNRNVLLNLDLLKEYFPQKLVNLLKEQGVKIYLYSSNSIFEKSCIVGLSVWKQNEKNAYIRENQWYIILHEIGHLLDCYAKKNESKAQCFCSSSEYFQSVFQKDRWKVEGSYRESVMEYFAESFMYYYLRPTNLRTERPDTYQAIQLFIDNL
jgi:hypothetical protein